MLYSPKWKQLAKVDPISLDGLIAWLETQPAQTTYDWKDCNGECLIGKYYKAVGIIRCEPTFYDKPDGTFFYSDVFRGLACNYIYAYARVCSSLSGPTTFGAALERARLLRSGL